MHGGKNHAGSVIHAFPLSLVREAIGQFCLAHKGTTVFLCILAFVSLQK